MRVSIEPMTITTLGTRPMPGWAVVAVKGVPNGPWAGDIMHVSIAYDTCADWCRANGHSWVDHTAQQPSGKGAYSTLDVIGALVQNIHIHAASAVVVHVGDDDYTIDDIQVPEHEDGSGDHVVATIYLGRPFDNRSDV